MLKKVDQALLRVEHAIGYVSKFPVELSIVAASFLAPSPHSPGGIVDAVAKSGHLVLGFIAPEAGASMLTGASCNSSNAVGSFRQSDLPAGMSADQYAGQLGVVVSGSASQGYWQCPKSATPEEKSEPEPEPEPEPTPAPTTSEPSTTAPAAVPASTTKIEIKRTPATMPPAPAATQPAVTTTPPAVKIELNEDTVSDGPTVTPSGKLVGQIDPVSLKDLSRDNSPKPTSPEPVQPKPTEPNDPRYLALRKGDELGDHQGDQTKLQPELAGGSPAPENEGSAIQAMSGSSSMGTAPSKKDLSTFEVANARNLTLQAAQEDIGKTEDDGIAEEVMPKGMSNQAWCAALYAKWSSVGGHKLNGGRFDGGANETGVLRTMELFKNGDPDSEGKKHLRFYTLKEVVDGDYTPKPGDAAFFSRPGDGAGHIGVVSGPYSPEGTYPMISGNLSKEVKEVTVDPNDLSNLGLTGTYGFGTYLPNDGASQESTQQLTATVTPPASGQGSQQVVVINNSQPQAKGLLEQAADAAKSLIPGEVEERTEFLLGRDINLKPSPPPPQQKQVIVTETAPANPTALPINDSVEVGGQKDTAKEGTEASSKQPANPESLKDLPEDPRDMSDEQLKALEVRLDALEFKETTSIEEFSEYYKDMFLIASKKSGAPLEFVMAHASIESGQSTKEPFNSRGNPSRLFIEHGNPWGIKVSDKNGCRTKYFEAANLSTQEGEPGTASRETITGKFCGYLVSYNGALNRAVESYVGLLAIERYGVHPPSEGQTKLTTEETIMQIHNGGYTTLTSSWPDTIRSRIERLNRTPGLTSGNS